MKKEHVIITISVIFVLTLLFSTVFKIDYKSLTTDSGFDSSYDSGGSDSGSSWSSSDYGSDGSGGSASPETVLGLMYIFLTSFAGFGVRKLFKNIKDDEEALMDVICSMGFLIPFTIFTGLLVEEKVANIIVGFGILTILFLAFNIVRKKPMYKYLAGEYIIFFSLLVFSALSSYLATGDIGSLIVLLVLIFTETMLLFITKSITLLNVVQSLFF